MWKRTRRTSSLVFHKTLNAAPPGSYRSLGTVSRTDLRPADAVDQTWKYVVSPGLSAVYFIYLGKCAMTLVIHRQNNKMAAPHLAKGSFLPVILT